MSTAPSLFEPAPSSVITGASEWIVALVSGSMATTLCVVAIAVLGMLMLSGHIQVRAGIRVVLGCFLILGAADLAWQLAGFEEPGDRGYHAEPGTMQPTTAESSPPLPPANYDPYAGASLPTNR